MKNLTFKVHDLDSGWSSFEITSVELAFSVLRAYRKKTMNSGGYHRKVVRDSEGHMWDRLTGFNGEEYTRF